MVEFRLTISLFAFYFFFLFCSSAFLSVFNGLVGNLLFHFKSIIGFLAVLILYWFLAVVLGITICFFFFLINLFYFIQFWLCWVFVAVCGLSLVAASGGSSSLWCAGFSLQRPFLLRSTGSRRAGFSSCGSRALEHRLSSCGVWAQLLRGMQDPPGPGLEPVSPALAGGFSTTAPPGKPSICFFNLSLSTQT